MEKIENKKKVIKILKKELKYFGSMRDVEILQLIEKIAKGYEYEEVQTIIEETLQGTKKKIVRNKKFQPANLQAAQYLLTENKKTISVDVVQMERLMDETIERLEVDENWKLK